MSKELLSYDPITGLRTWFDYDASTDTTELYYDQEVDDILELNKAMANDEDYSKNGIKQGWWHIGSIPASLIMKWRVEEGIDVYNKDHTKRVLAKLNDADFSRLKTTSGKHV